jgi:hypothetical protein
MNQDNSELVIEVFRHFDSIDRPFITVDEIAAELDLSTERAKELLLYMEANGMYHCYKREEDNPIYWPTSLPNIEMEARAQLIAPAKDKPLSLEDLRDIVCERS